MSLITGNKVKKKPHQPWYCEKEKDKANKRILRSLSFDNNGLVKPSCGTQGIIKQGEWKQRGHQKKIYSLCPRTCRRLHKELFTNVTTAKKYI